MINTSNSRNAFISAVITLTACSLPPRRSEDLDSTILRCEHLGQSKGVTEMCESTTAIQLEVTKGAVNQITFKLPLDFKQNGQSVIVDGLAHSISLINPSFIKSIEKDLLFRDSYGNAIQVTQLGNPNLNPVPKIMINFPLTITANGESKPFDFDLRPIGGPLVTDFVIGKTVTLTTNTKIISDLDDDRIQYNFQEGISGLIEGTNEVEHLWNSGGNGFVEHIALIDHPSIFAGCNEGSPFKFMLSTGCLNNLQNHNLDAAPLARHESLHILDRHLGFPSASEKFQGIFTKISISNPSFFEAINEQSVFQNEHMGGHSSDNPKELFASFINFAIQYDKLGKDIPANLHDTAAEVSHAILCHIEQIPGALEQGAELIRILKNISKYN